MIGSKLNKHTFIRGFNNAKSFLGNAYSQTKIY
jgi:hypothetical protein